MKTKIPVPDKIDYETDDLETIRAFELARLKGVISELSNTDRLCSDTGASIVHEFQFKGNLKDVKIQLLNLREQYHHSGVKDEDRITLLTRDRRSLQYTNEGDKLYSDEFRKKLGTDFQGAMKISNAMKQRADTLHDKKECLCYTNYEIKTN